jgi:molecular chaperone HscB
MHDYFELLSIEKRYNIDLELLNQQYLAMQVKYHPDRAVDKAQNLSISVDLNRAYSVLKDDFKRAEYMLSLQGLNLDALEAHAVLSDLELNHIWNDLEKLENTDDKLALEEMLQSKLLERNILIVKITDAFGKEDLKSALGETVRLKYLNNLLDNIELKIKS